MPHDETREHAREDGFEPQDIERVIPRCHILMLLIPDEVVPEVYLEKISPYLARGHLLVFASGYNIAFGFVEPPPFVDVGMIAPRTIGAAVRSRFLDGSGFYSFVGAGQDATGTTLETLLALAKAMGSLRAGAIEMSMQQESQLDLFVQQAILPAFHHVMTTAADVLLEMGYPPEAVMMDSDHLRRIQGLPLARIGTRFAARHAPLVIDRPIWHFQPPAPLQRTQAGGLDGSIAARHPQRRLLGGMVARVRKRLSSAHPPAARARAA